MNYIYQFCIAFLLIMGAILGIKAQAPHMIHYQAVIHDGADVLSNTEIGIRTSILQDSAKGSVVHVQTDTLTTSSDGLVNITIGQSSNQIGVLANVDWSSGPFFVKLETDPAGGDMYTDSTTTQFVSVPYGYLSGESASVNLRVSESGDTLYVGNREHVIVPGISEINFCVTCYPAGYQYCNGVVTEIVDVFNPVTGRIWMDRNLGALRQAQSSTDAQAYGDSFQWGRFADGHQCRFPKQSETTLMYANTAAASPSTDWYGKFIIESINPTEGDWLVPQDSYLWTGVDAVNNPCPSGYRLPTNEEWDAERSSWTESNSSGAFASLLKLPVSGVRTSEGQYEEFGELGYYWSSSVNDIYARILEFSHSSASLSEDLRTYGYSVRCIKNTPPPAYPSDYVHCLANGDTTIILGVISPTTEKVWMDRNLGASHVATAYNDGDSYGDLFQWGRFADGHQCRNSGTTTTLATMSTPVDSLFILNSDGLGNWLNPQNGNLWQGVGGVNNPCPSGYRIPTKAEWEAEVTTITGSFAFSTFLKLPLAGYRDRNDGSILSLGGLGAYWSSDVDTNQKGNAIEFWETGGNYNRPGNARGYSVRCVKD